MNQQGFALLGILITLVIVLLLLGGGSLYFFNSTENATSPIEIGIHAIEQAEELKAIMEERDQQFLEEIPELY